MARLFSNSEYIQISIVQCMVKRAGVLLKSSNNFNWTTSRFRKKIYLNILFLLTSSLPVQINVIISETRCIFYNLQFQSSKFWVSTD
jgi:hypothetical protein